MSGQIAYEEVILNDVIEYAFRILVYDKVALGGYRFWRISFCFDCIHFSNPDKVALYIFDGWCIKYSKKSFDGYYDDNCFFGNPQVVLKIEMVHSSRSIE